MITGIDLDHVAVAVEAWEDAWPRYRRDLGGEWVSGGAGPGFAPAQVRFANGMKVEVLRPNAVEVNDFLRRFLDRSGPGPHHLTFKVADISAALAEAEAAGVPAVGVDLRDPQWKEAFLHPKAAHGIVVQLAQSSGEGWRTPPPAGFPPSTAGPATLEHVSHLVRSLDGARRLFAGLLGGEEVDRGEDEAARWVELRWPGPGRLRLVEPASPGGPLRDWLGDLPGRVHHLAFASEDPAAVPGARPLADGRYEVPPEENRGVRLVLRPAVA